MVAPADIAVIREYDLRARLGTFIQTAWIVKLPGQPGTDGLCHWV